MNLKEENEELREILRRVYNYVPIPDQIRIDSVLSEQDGNEVASPAQDERDAFYAGLYKKSAPMWHRLHELAVSKGYDHVQFAIECAPVYRCDCMGARKVAIDMAGNTIPCECVAAANETEQRTK